MILLIDNYDSFVHNLARYLVRLGCQTQVVRNDALSVEGVRSLQPEAIVLSPGPGTPEAAGISVDLVRQLYREVPILGICLGHQAIAVALGGQAVCSGRPMHGRTSFITHDGTGLFADVPSPFLACRYHSLIVPSVDLPGELKVTASCDEGTVMAVEHESFPVVGLQFHPEAILTEYGYRLLSNFLQLAGIEHSGDAGFLQDDELRQNACVSPPLPDEPVTF